MDYAAIRDLDAICAVMRHFGFAAIAKAVLIVAAAVAGSRLMTLVLTGWSLISNLVSTVRAFNRLNVLDQKEMSVGFRLRMPKNF
jgi:hypothetical protein